MQMRRSKVLEKLRAGEVVNCFKQNVEGSRATEIAAMTGFDCVWTDMEHTATDWETVEKQVLATKCHDTDILVRINRGGYSDYVKPLELDATGIMVPHCMGLADAQNIARMTRFHPIGLRAIDGGNADGGYCLIDFNEYLVQANRERFVIIQIEDPEPLDELEEIAQVEGIDMIFFGPGDFSQSIGAPGQFNHPLLLETRRRVAEVCRKHGKFAGTPGSLANMEELIDMGYQFLNIGADVVGLGQYCNGLVEGWHERAGKRAPAAEGEAKGIYK